MVRSYVIGVGYWIGGGVTRKKVWIVPMRIEDEDLVCHTLAGGVRVCR